LKLTADRQVHPLAVYDPDADDVLFLNARAGRKPVEYLSYTSGDTQRPVVADELRDLLSRALRRGVTAEELDHWAERSLAEEQVAASRDATTRPEPKRIGDFELISVIGEGGMGRVYRAWQPSLGRQVALKRLNQTTDETGRWAGSTIPAS
jgi:hypothetical protein